MVGQGSLNYPSVRYYPGSGQTLTRNYEKFKKQAAFARDGGFAWPMSRNALSLEIDNYL